MSRFDQAKMLMQARKVQKELQKQIITIEEGDGAVKVEITGEQKIKRIHIDSESVDLDDIGSEAHVVSRHVHLDRAPRGHHLTSD